MAYDGDIHHTGPSSNASQERCIDAFSSYILQLLPLLLTASPADLRRSLLQASNYKQLVTRFIDEPSCQSVYINKHKTSTSASLSSSESPRTPLDLEEGPDEETETGLDRADRGAQSPTSSTTASSPSARYEYTITTSLAWHPTNVASLALIKRVPTIDATRPIPEQLHFVNLFGPALAAAVTATNNEGGAGAALSKTVDDGEDGGLATSATVIGSNPYESLHSIVHLAVQPYFEAYVSRKTYSLQYAADGQVDISDANHQALTGPGSKAAGGGVAGKPGDEDSAAANTAIPIAKKKFAELELSLLHLQQNVEIPEIVLGVHPVVARAVEKVSGKRIVVQDSRAGDEGRATVFAVILNAPPHLPPSSQARQLGIRPTPELIEPASLLSDTSFLNKIQGEVNKWIKETQSITKLNRDVASGTASQEINFWLSMEKALEGIEEQLRSEPITLTLDILKYAKRFHATVSFIADTGLKESTDVVMKYNLLMKDFPLNELLAATDLDRIGEGLVHVFNHLNKKLKLSPYPIRRALPLVEAISKDLSDQILRVLQSSKLMYANYATFESALSTVASIFATWEDLMKEFTNVAREVTRKRSEKFLPIKINAYHQKEGLQARVEYLRNFRKHHEQLVGMVSPTKGVISGNDMSSQIAGLGLLGGLDMEEEVREAWEAVKHVDVLDTSTEGTQIWVTAETA